MNTARTRSNDDSGFASMETHLQNLIYNTSNFLTKDFAFSLDKRDQLCQIEIEYRQQMRVLRRWRNGTDKAKQSSIEEFSNTLDQLRNESIRIRAMVVANTLVEVDALLHKLGPSSHNIISQRQTIGCEMVLLHEKMKTLKLLEYKKHEDQFISMEDAIINIKRCILDENKTKSKRKFSMRRHSMSSASTAGSVAPIEEHPEVNRVLKNAARIRRMMEAFREGFHVNVDATVSCACVENDLEVLRRQLQKVRQWQQSILGFTKEEVEDLELILSAIQRHILPDIDLESPLRKSLSGSSAASSRSNSRLSEISSDISFCQPSPRPADNLPTYEEACEIEKTPHKTNKDFNDNNSSGVEIFDERLI